jgi:hypothetical protein
MMEWMTAYDIVMACFGLASFTTAMIFLAWSMKA